MAQFSTVSIAEGARWALLMAFMLAAIEKARALRAGAAAWHPTMMASARRRRLATPLMRAALVFDVLVVVALATLDVIGPALAGVMIVSYSVWARGAHSDDSCQCFWGGRVLNSRSAEGLLARNLMLVLLTVPAASSSAALTLAGAVSGAAALVLTAAVMTTADNAAQRLRSARVHGSARNVT